MPKYANYPPVTTIAAADVILFHKDSSNSEVVITFSNLNGQVLAQLPVSSLPAAGTVAGTDIFILSNSGVIKGADLNALVASIPTATSLVAGTMSAADKIKLDAATDLPTASTLVKRSALGDSDFHDINIDGKITFDASSSTNLYSPASSNTIKTDGAFEAVGLIYATSGVILNAAGDTSLTSPSANLARFSDALDVVTALTVGTTITCGGAIESSSHIKADTYMWGVTGIQFGATGTAGFTTSGSGGGTGEEIATVNVLSAAKFKYTSLTIGGVITANAYMPWYDGSNNLIKVLINV